MKTITQFFSQSNLNFFQRLVAPKQKDFTFCASNKEMIDKLIKEIGICLN